MQNAAELMQEIESVRAMNASLRAYLEHIRTFKKNLMTLNENCNQLTNINEQWVETIRTMKK